MSRTMTSFSGSPAYLKTLRQGGSPWLVPDVGLPVNGIGCRPSHNDLDRALVVIIVMPHGTEACDGFVEIDADPAAHADNQPLAVHAFQSALEVRVPHAR
jgi:hypothetical protein